MNKFLSICAVSGIFLFGNGCDGFKVPCTNFYSADSPQCNRSDYPTVPSKSTISRGGDMLTISIPLGNVPEGFNFQTAADLSVSLVQFTSNPKPGNPQNMGEFAISSTKYPSIIAAKRPTALDLVFTAEQLQSFSTVDSVIRIYANGKWTVTNVTIVP